MQPGEIGLNLLLESADAPGVHGQRVVSDVHHARHAKTVAQARVHHLVVDVADAGDGRTAAVCQLVGEAVALERIDERINAAPRVSAWAPIPFATT
jgi:hypothetical protein